ncbi:MAG: ATP-binding protein, partial [Crinalium sp.]
MTTTRLSVSVASLKASKSGLAKIRAARNAKGWTIEDHRWLEKASKILGTNYEQEGILAENISPGTWNRFLHGKSIRTNAFKAYCQVLKLDWQEICEQISTPTLPRSYFINYNDGWVGRKELIAKLTNYLKQLGRVLILTGITGIGKTALAEILAIELQDSWTDFYHINFDDRDNASFVNVTANLLMNWQEIVTPNDLQQPEELLNRLIERLQANRYLLQIDSFERILQGNEETGWSDFQDPWWEKFFEKLLVTQNFTSKVIVTSQDAPRQLDNIAFRYSHFWRREKLTGLTQAEQLELFSKLGLELNVDLSQQYLERIGAAYEGHPLALKVIAGEILGDRFNGNIIAYWNNYGKEIEEIEQARRRAEIESVNDKLKLDRYTGDLRAKVRTRIEQTFERLAKDFVNAYFLLCHGAVYRRPVPETALLRHLKYLGCNEDQQNIAIDVLRDRYLVEEVIDNNDYLLRQHN